MKTILFVKKKKNYLYLNIRYLLIKKILFAFDFKLTNWKTNYTMLLNNTVLPNFNQLALLNVIGTDWSFVNKKKFLQNIALTKTYVRIHFFHKQLNFNIVIKITKFNFFISPTSNINLSYWKTFLTKKYMNWSTKVNKFNSVYTHSTISAGGAIKNRKTRLTFKTFTLGSYLTSLTLSIFWVFLNNISSNTSPYLKFSIKVNGQLKWVKSLIYTIRKSFKLLQKEHRWYLYKYRNIKRSRSLTDIEVERYNYSVMSLKKMAECPLKIESIQLSKSLPHNGCRLKKTNLRCKMIKTINKRRKTR